MRVTYTAPTRQHGRKELLECQEQATRSYIPGVSYWRDYRGICHSVFFKYFNAVVGCYNYLALTGCSIRIGWPPEWVFVKIKSKKIRPYPLCGAGYISFRR